MSRRLGPLAVVLAVALLAACAGPETDSTTGAGAPPTSVTGSEPSAAPTSPPSPPGPGPAPASVPTTKARGGAGAGGGAASAPPSQLEAFAGARGNPGSFATLLLQPQPAARLVLEVLQQAGAQPRDGTVAHLVRLLQDSSRKPVSVATVALPAGGGAVSADAIRALADRHGRAPQGPDQAVVRILFLAGQLEGEPSALGAAVRGDTAAVLVEQVRSAGSPLVGSSALEPAVAAHELGHLLGLVDLVRATGRADPEHPGHSANRGSVMYWAIESDLVTSVLTGPPPMDFDGADLAAIRSGS